MAAYIGVSGWRYAPWRGDFYPAGLPQKRELAYAAERFNTIELNDSVYSLQRPSGYAQRYRDVPADFVFAVKGSRYITHLLRLKDVKGPLANFFASGLFGLEHKVGPMLWQLPKVRLAAYILQSCTGTTLMEEGNMLKGKESSAEGTKAGASPRVSHDFVLKFHGVRYQVEDVARSVAFYTQTLGFEVEHQQLPDFAAVSLGALKILLSGRGASGSRPMPNGQRQEPGGWNRIVLRVTDLASCIEALRKDRLHFRNEMETGPGGKQIQIDDPDGNPIELFEPARSKH